MVVVSVVVQAVEGERKRQKGKERERERCIHTTNKVAQLGPTRRDKERLARTKLGDLGSPGLAEVRGKVRGKNAAERVAQGKGSNAKAATFP